MSRYVKLGLVSAAVLAFVVACQKQDIEADKATIRTLVAEDTVHFQCGTEGDSTENDFFTDDTTIGLWWRGPQTHDPTPVIEVEVVDDSAWVGWHQHNYGELIHWVKTSDSTSVRWIKALTEKVQLNAIFVREGQASSADRGWKLKKVSLATGVSDTVNTVRIDSMRIQSSLRDIMIADPQNTYYLLDSLVTFTPAELLTITLYTNAVDGFAYLHAFWTIFFVRVPFQSQGEGVFTGTWYAQLWPGFRFAIFEVVSNGTLLDADAAYDYNGWLFPYAIKSAD